MLKKLLAFFERKRLYAVSLLLAAPICIAMGLTRLPLSEKRAQGIPFLSDIITFINSQDNRWYDTLMRQQALSQSSNRLRRPARENIRLVGITEETIETLGAFPFDRKYYAQLLDVLDAGGAKAVFFDFLYSSDSREQLEVDKCRAKGGKCPHMGSDEIFAAALARKNNRLLAYHFDHKQYESMADREEIGQNLSQEERMSASLTYPVPRIRRAVSESNFGLVSFAFDYDNIARRVPLTALNGVDKYRHADLVLFCWAKGLNPEEARFHEPSGTIRIGAEQVPLQQDMDEAYYYVYKYGLSEMDAAMTAITIPFHEAIQMPKDYAVEEFKDKIVFVGPIAPAIEDMKTTPVGNLYGIKCHINIFASMLTGSEIRSIFGRSDHRARYAEMIFISILGVGLGLLYARVRKTWLCAILGLAATGVVVIGSAVLFLNSLWMPIAAEILCIIAVTIAIIAYVEILVRRTFKDFVPDIVVERIIAGESVNRDVEATVLFCDIRGFTTLSEQKESKEMIEIVNEFHQAMTKAWSQFRGYRFDFQGDAQMVVFGAIEHYSQQQREDHALLGVKSALAMQYELEILREKWIMEKRPVFEMGIGVHTGVISMGVVGGHSIGSGHKQFTAIGDVVNTSSRLQGLSRQLESPIIASSATYELVKDHIWATPLGEVDLKGKVQKVGVYRINGFLEDQEFQEFRKGVVDIHVQRSAHNSAV
ncbi:MAG: adenylate/guanylate cyclase domain-containing protein [Armatimonadetes bacterium]|nr:adenylate/guanylate cyclase domain-containing protein [Armatimonadota bacterium]